MKLRQFGFLYVFFFVLAISAAFTAHAQTVVTKTPVATGPLHEVNEYFSTQTIHYSDGTSIARQMIKGPPAPPAGYELQRKPVSLPANVRKATKTLTVPAFSWVFGCSAVSGAMIAGYYDRNGYPNLYTGPTGGGVYPLTEDSSWGTWSDGYTTYPNNPLVASHNGLDGRSTKGSIDDYWVQYNSAADDPYITGSWTQHAWAAAIGDYMKTSQSAHSNTDASTTFYGYPGNATKLTCAAMESYGVNDDDGTYGRKLFYEAKGYTVTDCYSQTTDNNATGGFSFADFKAQIDANRPVMLNLDGHTIVGVGYDDSTNTIYIHDTWDNDNHTMTWGGSYSDMELLGVSIVNLQSTSTFALTVAKAGTGGGTVSSSPTGINCGSTCSSTFASGTIVTLTATPDQYSAFSGWSGCDSTSGTSCTITMGADKSVTANFVNLIRALTVVKAGTGGGTVSSSPTGINCGSTCSSTFTSGTSVTLTAIADQYSVFGGWSGCDSSSGASCTVTLTANKSVTANFADPCTYAVAPASKTFTYKGGSMNITVIARGLKTCRDPVVSVSDGSWISAVLMPFRNNRGTVKVTVSPNPTTTAKPGSVTVAGADGNHVFTVNQTGSPCSIATSAPSAALTSASQSATFNVSAPAGCAWTGTVLSGGTWLNLAPGTGGNGNGTVTYGVIQNTTNRNRVGTIKVALTVPPVKSKVFRVTQLK